MRAADSPRRQDAISAPWVRCLRVVSDRATHSGRTRDALARHRGHLCGVDGTRARGLRRPTVAVRVTAYGVRSSPALALIIPRTSTAVYMSTAHGRSLYVRNNVVAQHIPLRTAAHSTLQQA